MATLRILSVNLLVDRADPEDLARVIAQQRPDVIATQELGPRTAAAIRESHRHGHLEPSGDFFGMGIAATRPISVERLPLARRSGWVARLEPENWPTLSAPLEVLDVHLVNPVDRPWGATRTARRRQIAQIGSYLAGRTVAGVIIGDMNSSPAWPEYRLLSALGVDAARATGSAKRTWAPFVRGPRLLRIDHAFVSGVDPAGTAVVPVRGTDHSALVVDLEMPS